MSSGNPLLLCLVLLTVTAGVAAQETANPVRPKRTPGYTAEGATGCLHCHSGPEMRAVQSGPHFSVQGLDVPAASNYCESCHGPGSIHVSRAHGGKGFPPLTAFGRGPDKAPREQQIAACLACHNRDGAVRTVIAFIGSPHDRGNINCSTCHRIHTEVELIAGREAQVAVCGRCHRQQTADHPDPGSRSDRAGLPCSDCHDAHEPMKVAE